ncbi:MAG: hypothetical protein Q9169_008032, partial [Polycauliona sp. 2 TL-2023]
MNEYEEKQEVLEEEKQALQTANDNLNGLNARQDNMILTKDKALTAQADKVRRITATCKEKEKEKSIMSREKYAIEQDVQKKDAKIKQLEAETSRDQLRIRTLRQDVTSREQRERDLEKEVADLRRQLTANTVTPVTTAASPILSSSSLIDAPNDTLVDLSSPSDVQAASSIPLPLSRTQSHDSHAFELSEAFSQMAVSEPSFPLSPRQQSNESLSDPGFPSEHSFSEDGESEIRQGGSDGIALVGDVPSVPNGPPNIKSVPFAYSTEVIDESEEQIEEPLDSMTTAMGDSQGLITWPYSIPTLSICGVEEPQAKASSSAVQLGMMNTAEVTSDAGSSLVSTDVAAGQETIVDNNSTTTDQEHQPAKTNDPTKDEQSQEVLSSTAEIAAESSESMEENTADSITTTPAQPAGEASLPSSTLELSASTLTSSNSLDQPETDENKSSVGNTTSAISEVKVTEGFAELTAQDAVISRPPAEEVLNSSVPDIVVTAPDGGQVSSREPKVADTMSEVAKGKQKEVINQLTTEETSTSTTLQLPVATSRSGEKGASAQQPSGTDNTLPEPASQQLAIDNGTGLEGLLANMSLGTDTISTKAKDEKKEVIVQPSAPEATKPSPTVGERVNPTLSAQAPSNPRPPQPPLTAVGTLPNLVKATSTDKTKEAAKSTSSKAPGGKVSLKLSQPKKADDSVEPTAKDGDQIMGEAASTQTPFPYLPQLSIVQPRGASSDGGKGKSSRKSRKPEKAASKDVMDTHPDAGLRAENERLPFPDSGTTDMENIPMTDVAFDGTYPPMVHNDETDVGDEPMGDEPRDTEDGEIEMTDAVAELATPQEEAYLDEYNQLMVDFPLPTIDTPLDFETWLANNSNVEPMDGGYTQNEPEPEIFFDQRINEPSDQMPLSEAQIAQLLQSIREMDVESASQPSDSNNNYGNQSHVCLPSGNFTFGQPESGVHENTNGFAPALVGSLQQTHLGGGIFDHSRLNAPVENPMPSFSRAFGITNQTGGGDVPITNASSVGQQMPSGQQQQPAGLLAGGQPLRTEQMFQEGAQQSTYDPYDLTKKPEHKELITYSRKPQQDQQQQQHPDPAVHNVAPMATNNNNTTISPIFDHKTTVDERKASARYGSGRQEIGLGFVKQFGVHNRPKIPSRERRQQSSGARSANATSLPSSPPSPSPVVPTTIQNIFAPYLSRPNAESSADNSVSDDNSIEPAYALQRAQDRNTTRWPDAVVDHTDYEDGCDDEQFYTYGTQQYRGNGESSSSGGGVGNPNPSTPDLEETERELEQQAGYHHTTQKQAAEMNDGYGDGAVDPQLLPLDAQHYGHQDGSSAGQQPATNPESEILISPASPTESEPLSPIYEGEEAFSPIDRYQDDEDASWGVPPLTNSRKRSSYPSPEPDDRGEPDDRKKSRNDYYSSESQGTSTAPTTPQQALPSRPASEEAMEDEEHPGYRKENGKGKGKEKQLPEPSTNVDPSQRN